VRVRVRQRVHDVLENAERVGHGQLALAGKLGAQRFPLHQRHRVVEQIAGLAGGMQRHDVRVLQRRGELDLAPEALDVHAGGHFRWQHFHYDAAPQRDFVREKHARHAAATQLPIERVTAAEGTLQLVLQLRGHRVISVGKVA